MYALTFSLLKKKTTMLALNYKHTHTHTHTGVTDQETSTGEGEENYLVVALAVGIPCGLIILVLFIVIILIIYLTLQSSRYYAVTIVVNLIRPHLLTEVERLKIAAVAICRTLLQAACSNEWLFASSCMAFCIYLTLNITKFI